MEIVQTTFTVADYCERLKKNDIIVNWKYQRSSKVWPSQAQSFLIESILLGFPVPALYLFQKTDRISRRTVREIIDGQQRTVAVRAFYDGDLRLSKTLEFEEAAGRTYFELDHRLQERFLSYGLDVSLFVNTEEEEVREVFRRINSYEVPLNAEEQRHAQWQGEFKWFIYHLSRSLDTTFIRLGAFSDKQLVRMQDMKLLAEITHAVLNGITTTNKRSLDGLYRSFDESFPDHDRLATRIEEAFRTIEKIESIHGSALTRPYSLYAMVLAMMHVRKALPKLAHVTEGGGGFAKMPTIERRLSLLAEAVEEKDDKGTYRAFVRATEKGTNVKAERETRFRYFVHALRKDGGTVFS